MVKNDKKDLRVVKTQITLYNALLELMKEKSFEEIKVSDICNKALINRSTFYSHYDDKFELLTDLLDDIRDNLSSELQKNSNSISSTKEYFIELIKLFLNYIEDRKDDYLSILVNNRNSIMLDIIYDVVDKDIVNRLKENNEVSGPVPTKVIAKFYLGAVVNVGIEWFTNMKEFSKDEMIEYIKILIPDEISI